MAEDQVEIESSGMEQELEAGFEEMIGMTEEEYNATESYLQEIQSEDALKELDTINEQLTAIKIKTGEYLTATMSWKDRITKGDALEEDNRTRLQRMLGWAKNVAGIGRSYESMPLSEQMNYLFADFQEFIGVIMEIRDDVSKKRKDADSHMEDMRNVIKQAVPRLEAAEANMTKLQGREKELEEMIKEDMTAREKMEMDEAKDELHNAWLAARKELRGALYEYELTDNVMETMRHYRNNLDVLIEEAEALQHDINLTVKTIRPLMTTIVSGAKIAEALTKGIDSYKMLKKFVNPVLAKTGEIGAVIPEVRRRTMNGEFIDKRVQEHLQDCYVKSRFVQNYGVIENLKQARETLKERGIVVEDFNPEEVVLGDTGPDDIGPDDLGPDDFDADPGADYTE